MSPGNDSRQSDNRTQRYKPVAAVKFFKLTLFENVAENDRGDLNIGNVWFLEKSRL